MSDMINLTDVESNQILVWSEIEQAFINITPSQALLNIETVSHQPLSPNANIVHSLENNILRSRGIVGGDNVTITETNTDIIISVDVETSDDAITLGGYSHLAYVKKSELNSLIDFDMIQDSIDGYTREEAHDQFMETNASNIPDADNTYDLGANGRRYADVYAKTFHGTATNAVIAQNVSRNGATENDVMTWVGNSWVPRPNGSIPLSNLNDVHLDNLSESQILAYDSTDLEWKNVAITDIFSGVTLQFTNTGYGEEIYTNTIGDTVRFKSLEANDGIILSSDENSIHIEIDVDYVDTMIDGKLRNIDVSNLENIFDITEINNNTMLVWDDGKIINRPIPVGGGDGSIDTSNAIAGQVLGFDGTNLVFVDQYNAFDDIDTSSALDGYYLAYNGTGYDLREITDNDTLSSVDTTNANNGDVLIWDGTQYLLSSMTTLDNIDVTGVSDGYVITYQGGEFILSEPADIGLTLSDLDDVNASDGYYVAYNGVSYELRELPTSGNGEDNDTLGDVSTVGANNGDLLVWNGAEYELRDIHTLEDVDTSTASDGYVLIYSGGEFVLSENTIGDTLEQLDTSSALDGYYVAFNGTGYELRELPDSNDTLGAVDTSSANNGDALTWNGTSYELTTIDTSTSLMELTDVNIDNPLENQVLTWNGSEFTLQNTISGANTISELDDVDETVIPENGDVLTYNTSKSKYEPLPFPTSNGTKYEILKVNYNVNGNFGSAEYLTDNINVSNVLNPDSSLLEITFSNYSFPPISIGYWGYIYNHNHYRYIAITEASSQMTVEGLGESGSPLVFDPNRQNKEFRMSVSARIGETKASASSGFPPNPTHAYIVFVMGE